MDELQKNKNNNIQVVEEISFNNRIQILEEIVRKEYLSRIEQMYIAKPELDELENDIIDNIRLYKITEMVYQKGELVTDKFTTVFNTLSTYATNAFIVMDSDGIKTDYYVGVRNIEDTDAKRSTVTIGDTLKKTLIGQFPGIKIENVDRENISNVSDKIKCQSNVASVSVLGSEKIEKIQSNEQFVQGLEKLAYAMNGRQYIGIIIAETQKSEVVRNMRSSLQNLHSSLYPLKSYQSSISETISRDKKFSEMDKVQKAAAIVDLTVSGVTSAVVGMAGAAVGGAAGGVAGFLFGNIPGAVTGVLGGVASGGCAGIALGGAIGKAATSSLTSIANLISPKETIINGKTHTANYENKNVADLIELVDEGIKRTKEFDSYGMWAIASYFLSEDMSTAEIAASNYRSLMNGEKSGNEMSAINSWRQNDVNVYGDFDDLTAYLSRFVHPVFCYGHSDELNIVTNATTVVSGKELGLHLGLPRKTVSGMPVIEHAEFGKEVISSSLFENDSNLRPEERMTIGKVYDLGKITDKLVELKNKSLTMHTFITGSTGSGKSNTVYQMLNELYIDKIPFLVIEPAKGEYKDVFGNREDVSVYSTNPNVAELININPFMFPDSIHVLEHIDGLVEIFSVCWPMYDAMPAFFKDAILRSYEVVGWDLGTSTFEGTVKEYPDFSVLLEQLDSLIEESSYASDIKSNYRGALLTRVKSLTVGLNKYIFTNNQTSYKKLFDENCIVDLSRVKSGETRALLMGLLVYILNEYRIDNKTSNNADLKHITVLEEAHNLLKNTSDSETDLVGKSVEMLTQTIAEIRTCGEGFIIVDQSPLSVDISAIKNTNTKIVLRTPEANDREAVGRSMGLNEEQINEIAKLPSGVAVVYQNDWVTPVLTMVDKAKINECTYMSPVVVELMTEKEAISNIITLILDPWVNRARTNIAEMYQSLNVISVHRDNKKTIEGLITKYFNEGEQLVWTDSDFANIHKLLLDVMNVSEDELANMGNADGIRKYASNKTVGFDEDDINVIGYYLSYMED